MGEEALKKYSLKEYLDFAGEAELRYEYHKGELFAMAGGTPNHSILGANIVTELNLLSRKKTCTVFNGDARIRIESSDRFLYPEASGVCGEIRFSEEDPNSLTNPCMIVEVFSETTEAYDRGTKFMLYQMIPSFQEYLLIDQGRPVVIIFSKKNQQIWEMKIVQGLDKSFEVSCLEGVVRMNDLYHNVQNLEKPPGIL